jgi:hypothetical protein
MRAVLGAGVSAAVVVLAACNALVGNGDIDFAVEAGPPDATTTPDAHVEASMADAPPPLADASDAAAAAEAGPGLLDASDAGCPQGTKACGGRCVSLDDPGYGCGATACDPCELAHANATCVLVAASDAGGAEDAGDDGGVDASGFSICSPLCKGTYADCNGDPLDGCEVDTSSDLYNCGGCGQDCSNLPHVAGNVSCAASKCSFDSASCAPGFGICSSNPADGCNTNISAPANCGGCSTACSNAGFPYCSPTGNAADPFACTSGCSAGLSLCGASCVNESTDPNHCGGCSTQCPAVTGGTPTCSGTGTCGFTCNANDHLCGSGSGASCAANNDANSCGVGAACGKCQPPANATATCSGGTTCGSTCNSNAHACGATCPLDTDPNNCGSLCGTNCPGPAAGTGTGVASCNGNACSVTCTNSSTLCGTACANTQTDTANCGGCGTSCGTGQTCSNGGCVCNAASCPTGCCNGNVCELVRACGTGGVACAVGCPATLPEAFNLALWLVADNYVATAGKWLDQSGAHADATCTGTCPQAVSAALNGHKVVSFSGAQFFALSDPNGQYSSATQSWTIFVVANPTVSAIAGAQLIAFSNGANAIGLQQSGGNSDLLFQLLSGSGTSSLLASNAWAGTWEAIAANVDPFGASLTVLGADAAFGPSGAIGTPASVDYSTSFLGVDPTQTLFYSGQIAEVIVFTSDLSPVSTSGIETYLAGRYGGL